MTINQARIRDRVTAAAIIASVVLFFRVPAIWIVDFVHANPHTDIVWKGQANGFFTWHIGVPLMMYVGLFAAKAKSFLEGFVQPMGFTLAFILIFYFVTGFLDFIIASLLEAWTPHIIWTPYIIVFSLCGATYFWFVKRLFEKHLDLSGSLTEFVCIAGPMVLMQLMLAFVSHLDF